MDGMDSGWVDYLHFGFLGEHVLFRSLRLDSFWAFLLTTLITTTICLSERFLTVVLNKNIQPRWGRWGRRRSRLATATWRSVLYGFVTFLRLLYMLIAMSYHLGAIAIVVIALSVGQFFVEYLDYDELNSERHVEEPLLDSIAGRRHRGTKLRSKPDSIFIHPTESNLARADAAALDLGIGGDTELVQGSGADGQSWQHGNGKKVAREMFDGSQGRVRSDTNNFDIGDEDEE